MNRLIELIKQLLKYQSTAIICGAVDYGLLIVFIELLGMNYLAATFIALLCAMIVQYGLNTRFVFDTSNEHHVRKFIGYAILGVIGIGMNTLIVYLCVNHLGFHYLPGKICSSIIVGFYNFISRKLYLEHIDEFADKNVR